MSEQLMPCPFCGEKATQRCDGIYYIVACSECAAETADEIKRKAIAAWNRRTAQTTTPQAEAAPSRDEALRAAAQRAVDEWADHLEDGDPVPTWVAPLAAALEDRA